MTEHEKRIREALCLADEGEELISVVASRDLRALLADLDAVRGLLLRIRQQDYLDDTYRARIDAALKGATA